MFYHQKIFWINIFAFFLSLQYATVSYSASTFLANLLSKENFWLIYSLGGVLAIILGFSVAKFLKKININRLIFYVITLALLNSYLLYLDSNHFTIYLQFAGFIGLSSLLFTLSSVILEEYSRDKHTGSIRGQYNAIMSSGFLLAPFISSFAILNFGMNSIFFLSSIFSLIACFVFYFFIAYVPKIAHQNTSFLSGLRKLYNNHDLLYITFSQFGITCFYVLAVIYFPFKLESVGISLVQYLSILLPVALSPFLFMPPLLGHLEDKMSNEKEILIVSYIGLILVLIIISFTESSSILVWAILLFLTRLCASSAEISTNSYLFKKIGAKEIGIISVFTTTDYLAQLIFTPIFTLIVLFTDLNILILSVSFFLCFMLVYISKLHDTQNYHKHKEWKEIWNKSKKRAGI